MSVAELRAQWTEKVSAVFESALSVETDWVVVGTRVAGSFGIRDGDWVCL
jgi:hypothetical protein